MRSSPEVPPGQIGEHSRARERRLRREVVGPERRREAHRSAGGLTPAHNGPRTGPFADGPSNLDVESPVPEETVECGKIIFGPPKGIRTIDCELRQPAHSAINPARKEGCRQAAWFVESQLHTQEVTGSSPVPPTIDRLTLYHGHLDAQSCCRSEGVAVP